MWLFGQRKIQRPRKGPVSSLGLPLPSTWRGFGASHIPKAAAESHQVSSRRCLSGALGQGQMHLTLWAWLILPAGKKGG